MYRPRPRMNNLRRSVHRVNYRQSFRRGIANLDHVLLDFASRLRSGIALVFARDRFAPDAPPRVAHNRLRPRIYKSVLQSWRLDRVRDHDLRPEWIAREHPDLSVADGVRAALRPGRGSTSEQKKGRAREPEPAK